METYVVGTDYKCLAKVLLLSTPNICFHEEIRKNIHIGLDKSEYQVNCYYYLTKTYVVGTR